MKMWGGVSIELEVYALGVELASQGTEWQDWLKYDFQWALVQTCQTNLMHIFRGMSFSAEIRKTILY